MVLGELCVFDMHNMLFNRTLKRESVNFVLYFLSGQSMALCVLGRQQNVQEVQLLSITRLTITCTLLIN